MKTIRITDPIPAPHYNAIQDALREMVNYHKGLEKKSKHGWAKIRHKSFAERYAAAAAFIGDHKIELL